MSNAAAIPEFTLFGETEHFPDVVHCEEFSARAPIHDWRISAHRHAQIAQLFIVHDGQIDATIDGLGFTVQTGDFLFIPPNKAHEFTFRPDTDGLVISIPGHVMKTAGPASNDLQAALAGITHGAGDASLAALSAMLVSVSHGSSAFRAQRAVGLVHSMLGLIAERTQHQPQDDAKAADLRLDALNALIAQHMADGWTASDYAAALAVSPGHLSRLCRATTGKGAAAYIQQAIVEEACRLLAFTQLPVSEVSYRLGFTDPSYFSKRFRRLRRVTPSAYRAQFVS